ncbi:aromatic prenyltransferase [Xylariaceae sp. FL0016]|nr:aromatic prenyltransferase [Xylariaceae sp. FL0016]
MTTETLTPTTSNTNGQMNGAQKPVAQHWDSSSRSTEFWRQYLRSLLVPILPSAGTYTESEAAAQVKFAEDFVAPCLGPMPNEAHASYKMTYVGSPFELSLNLTANGKAKVRYTYEVVGPAERTGEDPLGEQRARDMLVSLSRATGADMQWMDSLMRHLYLTPEETESIKDTLPDMVPTMMLAYDLDGAKTNMKMYIPAMRKAVATGRSSTDLILDALRDMQPLGDQLLPGLKKFSDFLSTTSQNVMLTFVGCDCVDPTVTKGARVKCYMHIPVNNWAAVEEVMTLGGRLTDETSLRRVEVLRSLWHLFRDEPADGEHAGDDAWSKPEKYQGTYFSGLQFSVEVSPGDHAPETKAYIPMFQLSRGVRQTEKNFESILKQLNHSWGHDGKYIQLIENIFGEERNYGHVFVSFSYSKTKGAYTTSYLGKPIQGDASKWNSGDFKYF